MRLLKKISDFSLFTALLGMALVTSTLADTLCEAEGNSRCWYTTPDGTGNGSIDNPGRLETLIPQLAAGDFLYLLDGVYSHYYQNNGTDYIININIINPNLPIKYNYKIIFITFIYIPK